MIQAIAMGLGAAASVAGLFGMSEAEETTEEAQRYAALASKATVKAEKQRRLQMHLEGQRQIRQAVRQMIVGRSVALSNATNQGAGNSSGAQGGMAQVIAEGMGNIKGIQQSLAIGDQIFKFNKQATNYTTQYNRLTSEASGQAAMGGALMSFGMNLMGQSGTIDAVGTTLGARLGI